MKRVLRIFVGSLGLLAGALAACTTGNGDSGDAPNVVPVRPPAADAGADSGVETKDADANPLDASVDARVDASACLGSGTVAVLAGDDTSLTGVVRVDGAAWSGGVIVGGAAKSIPAIAAFGAGFVGVTRGVNDVLQSVDVTTSFASPSTIVSSNVTDAPALTVVGTTAHLAWLGGSSATKVFFHGQNAGSGWDAANDAVGAPQDFGNSAATLASVSGNLAFAQDGANEGLYAQTWNGAWSASTAIAGAGTFQSGVPPVLVSPGSDSFDLVLMYADNSSDHEIGYATRSPSDGSWSAAKTIALASTSTPFAATALSASTIVVAFRGNDGKAYTTIGTIGASELVFSAPTSLPGVSSIDGSPAIAKGVCGDDAIVVYATEGRVNASHLAAAKWSMPEVVLSAEGSRVAVATR